MALRSGTFEIWACLWLLRPKREVVCGYVQNGPGNCPYGHDEEVPLVKMGEVEWEIVQEEESHEKDCG